uniref:hypothetical protein n=1 Tax=Okeania sp. SIO2F4 TaxID=2607790 RepID=UPI0025E7D5C3|nr:hypothetical protein [Okeania sp. SIO2F4]
MGEYQYQVIGNSFIFAVAEAAGLEKVWCIIADESEETEKISKILSGEKTPQINLSTATRDEIKAALQYLIEKPDTKLKGVKDCRSFFLFNLGYLLIPSLYRLNASPRC